VIATHKKTYKVLLKVPDGEPLSFDVSATGVEAKGDLYEFFVDGVFVASFPKTHVLAVMTKEVVAENVSNITNRPGFRLS
jgi:hypothetical protein